MERAEEMRLLVEEQKRLDERERKGRQAIVAAITAYLAELRENGAENGEA